MNRYQRKCKHKRHIKREHVSKWYWGHPVVMSWEQFCIINEDCKHALKYWRNYYLSEIRVFAKKETNRRLRASDKILKRAEFYDDEEDFFLHQRAAYRKAFDYDWTLW